MPAPRSPGDRQKCELKGKCCTRRKRLQVSTGRQCPEGLSTLFNFSLTPASKSLSATAACDLQCGSGIINRFRIQNVRRVGNTTQPCLMLGSPIGHCSLVYQTMIHQSH